MTDDTSASCYVTLAYAAAYFAARSVSSDFTGAEMADQIAALETATRRIDSQPFAGTKYDLGITAGVPDQVRQFPRIIDGVTVDWDSGNNEAIVPDVVMQAVCEEALAVLRWGDSFRRRAQEQGVKEIQLGSGSGLRESYAPGAGRGLMSQEAKDLLRQYKGFEVR